MNLCEVVEVELGDIQESLSNLKFVTTRLVEDIIKDDVEKWHDALEDWKDFNKW